MKTKFIFLMMIFSFAAPLKAQMGTGMGMGMPPVNSAPPRDEGEARDDGKSRNQPPSLLGGLGAQCPFKSADRNVQALITQAKVALSSLARENSGCPGSQATSQQLQAAFDQALLNAFPGSGDAGAAGAVIVTTGSETGPSANCQNYEVVLRNEFDLAWSASKNEYLKDGMSMSRYSACARKNESEFEECTTRTYLQGLQSYAKNCETGDRVRNADLRSQNLRASLHNIANLTEELIRSSGSCKDGDKIAKSVLQTAIGSVSAISAFAPATGLAGVAISLGSKILSAVTDRFFDDKSPKKMIETIEEEERSEDLNCLYYLLQKEALGCDKQLFKGAGQQIDPKLACDTNQRANAGVIKDTTLNIQAILDKSDKNTAANKEQAFYKVVKSMEVPIDDPLGGEKQVPFHQYLKNISQNLDRSADLESKKLAGGINAMLESYSKLQAKVKSGGNEKAGATDLSSEQVNMIQAMEQLGPSGIERAIQKYWEAKGQGDTLSKLQSHERIASDIEAGNKVSLEVSKEINDVIADANSQRKIDLAHSAFVNSFQKKNEERLKKLNLVWHRNRSYQEADDAIKDMIPVVQMCTINAGLSYFGQSNFETKSRNLVSNQIPPTYREACGQFSCKLPIFDSTRFGDSERAREYKKYQCSMYVRYPDIIKSLADNMKKTGKPCP